MIKTEDQFGTWLSGYRDACLNLKAIFLDFRTKTNDAEAHRFIDQALNEIDKVQNQGFGRAPTRITTK